MSMSGNTFFTEAKVDNFFSPQNNKKFGARSRPGTAGFSRTLKSKAFSRTDFDDINISQVSTSNQTSLTKP
jgi:hypothetical protein